MNYFRFLHTHTPQHLSVDTENQPQTSTSISILRILLVTRLRSLLSKIWNVAVNLNLFKTPFRNVEIVHRQRLVTRIFLICLALSVCIASLQAFFSTQTQTIVVSNPSVETFELLWQSYSDNLNCPCSQISIDYADFITIVPTFHQICSSRFISFAWFNQLAQSNISLNSGSAQFEKAFGANYFQILATFCSLTNNTIADVYRLFSANSFINYRALPKTLFTVRTAMLTTDFVRSVESEFVRIFALARNTSSANQFASRTFSNLVLSYSTTGQFMLLDLYFPYLRVGYPVSAPGLCSCLNEGALCGEYSFVYNGSNTLNRIYLTNMIRRCLPMESALSSTLECWYDRSCLASVLKAYTRMGISDIVDIEVLTDVPSQFPRNATLEMMMSKMMIENWTTTVSHEHFYGRCAPLSCTYTIERRFDWCYVLITIIGLFSGLNTGLRLLLPSVVRIALFFTKRVRMQCGSRQRSVHIVEGMELDGKSLTHDLSKDLILLEYDDY